MIRSLLLSLGVFSAAAGHAAFDLVRGGRPEASVVIPASASPAERFAAEELVEFISRITGAALPIVATDAPVAGPAVIVGGHPANAELAAELDRRHPGNYDRFAWRAAGDRLQLVASTGDGIAWAVWDWLERTQEVAFLMPGRHGTYWPKRPEARAADGEAFEAPDLEFRSYSVGVPEFMRDDLEHGLSPADIFRYRQRFNMWTTLDPADTYGWLGSGHSYDHYLPIARYGETHPEWYALQNGRRRTSGGGMWQLCLSNPESPAVFAANAIGEIDAMKAQGIPETRILLCVVPNDLGGWCECAECLALRDPDGTWSSAVLHYANAVAAELAPRYPELKILHFVYHDFGRIPTRTVPRDNVYICITAWTALSSLAIDMTAGMFDPAKNPVCHSVLEWFESHSSGVMNYGYYGHYEHFTPWPVLDQIASDIKTLAASPAGFGSYSESHQHWGTQAPNFYLHANLMWDASPDPYELLGEFCRKAFGPAAPELYEYFTFLQQRMNSLSGLCGVGAEIPTVLTPEVIAQCDAILAGAAAKLPALDEAARWRTRLALDAWRASALYAEALRLLNYGSTPEDRRRILDNLDQVEAYAVTEEGRIAFEYPIVRDAIAQIRGGAGLDLAAIPLGESSRAGHLMYGGTVKFWASGRNIRPDMWGFYLPEGGEAELVLPLRTVPGAEFAAVKVRPISEHAAMEVFAVGADGVERRVESAVPAEALNSSELRLVFRFTLPAGQNGYGLTGLNLEITAVPSAAR